MKLHFAFAPETNGSCGIHEPNCDFATFKVWNLRSYILSCRMSCNTALKRWGTPPSSTESPDKEISRFPGLECASGLHGNSTWTTNLPKTEWANHLSFQKIVPPKIIQSPILVLRTPPVFYFYFLFCARHDHLVLVFRIVCKYSKAWTGVRGSLGRWCELLVNWSWPISICALPHGLISWQYPSMG